MEQVRAWLKGKVACKMFDAVADLEECVNDILDNRVVPNDDKIIHAML